jgi:hypothetical protein
MLWKIGDRFWTNNQESVNEYWSMRHDLICLQRDFSWEYFEKGFEPQKGSCIWKLYVLHIILPDRFPIFDQHVYRTYNFTYFGGIKELTKKPAEQYREYREGYLPWFENKVIPHCNYTVKQIDEGLFVFGKALQKIHARPHQIYYSY